MQESKGPVMLGRDSEIFFKITSEIFSLTSNLAGFNVTAGLRVLTAATDLTEQKRQHLPLCQMLVASTPPRVFG